MRWLGFIIFSLDVLFSVCCVRVDAGLLIPLLCAREIVNAREQKLSFFLVAFLLQSGSYLPVLKGRQYMILER